MADTATVETQFGRLTLTAEGEALTAITWGGPAAPPPTPFLAEAAAQIAAYDAGDLRDFDLALAPEGGALQQAVMAAMRAIPYGETRTYGEIAADVGAPPQAVGQCCGANPIPVVIPCHRVTAAGGLGGFSARGGVETKVALLRHEGAFGLLL